MINFEEELKKFHPSLEVEEAEEAIYTLSLQLHIEEEDRTVLEPAAIKLFLLMPVNRWVVKHIIYTWKN